MAWSGRRPRLPRVRPVRLARVLLLGCTATAMVLAAPVAVPMVFAAAAGTRALIRSRRFNLFGRGITRVETSAPLVALTFDDGPYLPDVWHFVLDELRRRSVRGTFFVIGREAERAPDLIRAAIADGHELGNHTYSHEHMVLMSQAAIHREVERTDRVIRAAGSPLPIHFRPPCGAKLFGLPRYLARHARPMILWDIDADMSGAAAPDAAEIVRRVLTRARPGSIVLLHALSTRNTNSRVALPGILDGLLDDGYDFVTVSELLAASAAHPVGRTRSASRSTPQSAPSSKGNPL